MAFSNDPKPNKSISPLFLYTDRFVSFDIEIKST